ncbi:MAG: putative transporter permease [Rhizobacter sp.]|nr:putative transporter permease [Rhizobacter sp.]
MLFDYSLRKELARSFGATLVVLLTILITMFLIRTLSQAAVGAVSPQDIVLLIGYTALGHVPTLLTLSLFVATVSTLSRMYRDSEMAVWFSSGVNLGRLVRPLLRMAMPVLIVIVLMSLFVWPWVNEKSNSLRKQYERRSDLSRVAPGQFQTSANGQRVFFIDRDSENASNARNVFVLTNEGTVESVVTARSGRLQMEGDDRFLVLDTGQRNDQDLKTKETTLARFETYKILAGDRAAEGVVDVPAKARRTIDLLAEPTRPFQGELVWRLGLSLAAINLLLIGIGLSASNPRRAGSWNLMLALLAFVIYYNLVNLSQAWVASGKASMGAMLLGLHGGAFVLAIGIMWWREHGLVLHPIQRARRMLAGSAR